MMSPVPEGMPTDEEIDRYMEEALKNPAPALPMSTLPEESRQMLAAAHEDVLQAVARVRQVAGELPHVETMPLVTMADDLQSVAADLRPWGYPPDGR